MTVGASCGRRRFRRGILGVSLCLVGSLSAWGDAFWDFDTSYRAPTPQVATKSFPAEVETFDSFVFADDSKELEPGFDSWCFSVFGPFSLGRFSSFEPSGFTLLLR